MLMSKLEARRQPAGVMETEPSMASDRTNLLHVLVCGGEGSGKTVLVDRLLGAGARCEGPADDVPGLARRAFESAARRFVLADARGHKRHTRGLLTGAGEAALAILVVDAERGVTTQTHRHCCIAKLFGIGGLAVAVNKMDAVGFDQARFEEIAEELTGFAGDLGIDGVTCIPVSAATGDAVADAGAAMPWYRGPGLLAHLEAVDVLNGRAERPFRMAVERIGDAAAKGVSGAILSGTVRPGDEITVLPAARRARVLRVTDAGRELALARAGDAVTLDLEGPEDIVRGDMLSDAAARAHVSDQVAAHLVWMGPEPMLPGRVYELTAGSQQATATISALKHKLSVDTLEHQAGKTLEAYEVGYCNLGFSRELVFDPFDENPDTGGFRLYDRDTGELVGRGLIAFGLRRATNISWQALDIDRAARAGLKGQRPCALWFTGLSGAGKSTVASLLEKRLHAEGRHTYVLDGDNVRHGLNKDLGFTDADRVENMRRVAETAKLFTDAGLIVMVSFISPFRSERRMARELFDAGDFIEVFVDAPMAVCEARDPKGLYKKARAGLIKNFTGIDSVYEAPEDADIRLDTAHAGPEELVDQLIAELERRGVV